MADPNSPIPADAFTGDTRPLNEALGKRFVEHAARKGWDEAAASIDQLEAGLLFPQDIDQERANVQWFFRAFGQEWVTRQ